MGPNAFCHSNEELVARWWPRESLKRLKSSRSMYSTATPHASPRGLSLSAREGVGQTVQKERPVGQAGQWVERLDGRAGPRAPFAP